MKVGERLGPAQGLKKGPQGLMGMLLLQGKGTAGSEHCPACGLEQATGDR
jgi:hypothetical protein